MFVVCDFYLCQGGYVFVLICCFICPCVRLLSKSMSVTSGDARHGLGGYAPKMSPSPHCETYWSESGDQLCEIFKSWSFLQSKSVNNVCKLLSLLGDPLPGLGPWTPLGDPVVYSPQMKYSCRRHCLRAVLNFSEEVGIYRRSNDGDLEPDPDM